MEGDNGGMCELCPINHYREAGMLPLDKCIPCELGFSTKNKTGESVCIKNDGLSPSDCGESQFLNNKDR